MSNKSRDTPRQVTLIGLGIMGHAFSRHLHEAGWAVVGFDISKGARSRSEKIGVSTTDSLHTAMQHSDLILLSLPSATAARNTIEKLLALKVPERTIVDLSTFSPQEKEDLARLAAGGGHVFLDCPVSGTGAQAARGDIVIYASGNPLGVERAKPAMQAISRDIVVLGEFGQGTKMKLVANLLVAIHNVASAEAMALGQAAGLGTDDIIKAVAQGAGNSRIFELRAPLMARQNYADATMKLGVWEKDMLAIAEFADELDVDVPLFSKTAPFYAQISHQHPEWDTAAVFELLRKHPSKTIRNENGSR